MKENVGRTDRIIRSIAGPALMAVGYSKLGGNQGDLKGLATIVAGATLLESAITRVCPLNGLFGIDSRSKKEIKRDLRKTIEIYERKPIDTEAYGLSISGAPSR